MATSQNGWSASPNLALRPLVIGGVSFLPGIRDNDDVEIVLRYVLTQFHERVEPLRNPGCWGFSYRENRNDPNSLSNHSSGTAVDANAPRHPNGVPTANTFSAAQISEVHQILAEVWDSVRWGGDYRTTPDSMHFEVNCTSDELASVARELEDDMPKYREWTDADKKALAGDVADEVAARLLRHDLDGSDDRLTVGQALRQGSNAPGLIRRLAVALGKDPLK